MPRRKQKGITFNTASDPETIDYYIFRLCECMNALSKMDKRAPEFNEAYYNASVKDMLAVYTLLDTIENTIDNMRENKCFKHPRGEGLRALSEVITDYIE